MDYTTKTGARMDPQIYQRLLKVLTDPDCDGMTQRDLAAKAEISERTLRNYLTNQLWEEVRKIRLDVVKEALRKVDEAMFQKALKGDTTAARLIYNRWEELHKLSAEADLDLPTSIAEIDAELKEIQTEIHELETAQAAPA